MHLLLSGFFWLLPTGACAEVSGSSENRVDGGTIVLDNPLAVFLYDRMEKWPGRDHDHRSIGMLNSGSVFHYRPDIDHVLTVLVDDASQESDKGMIGHDFLGDSIDQESGIDQGFAGTLAFDSAFGEPGEWFSAGDLAADVAFDFPNKQDGVLDGYLSKRQGQSGTWCIDQFRTYLVPVSESLNSHGDEPI